MVYINIKNSSGPVETVDEFMTRKEGLKMLKEYRISDTYNNYYLSTRSTKEWRESQK